ncbi:MAG: hypothetical protein WBM63_01660, partial [Sedimenticolaceae bacterium]
AAAAPVPRWVPEPRSRRLFLFCWLISFWRHVRSAICRLSAPSRQIKRVRAKKEAAIGIF